LQLVGSFGKSSKYIQSGKMQCSTEGAEKYIALMTEVEF